MTTKPRSYKSGGGSYEYILQVVFTDSTIVVTPRFVNLMSFGAFAAAGDVEYVESEWKYSPSALTVTRNSYRHFYPVLEAYTDSITYEKR